MATMALRGLNFDIMSEMQQWEEECGKEYILVGVCEMYGDTRDEQPI